MRIFIGMTENAGYYGQLAKGLKEIGHTVTFVGGNTHLSDYIESREPQRWMITMYEYFDRIKNATPRNQIFMKVFCIFMRSIFRVPIFFWALFKCDAFIFGLGTSLLPANVDLPVLRLFSKKIISNLGHGSEARPPYIDGYYLNENMEHLPSKKLVRLTQSIRKRCAYFEKHSDVIISLPLTSHFFKKPAINSLYIGRPFELSAHPCTEPPKDNEALRVLHCPSHAPLKGTLKIRECIKNLRRKGHRIEYIEISGQPNEVVLDNIMKSDIVIDQLFSDLPLSRFATEAGWFAKPVVVGGYGWDLIRRLIPRNALPPSLMCHPDEVEEVVERLITNKHLRLRSGQAIREFIISNWSPKQVAERYEQLIDNSYPKEWEFNPYEIIHVNGCGLSEAHAKAIVQNYIQVNGIEALCLSDKPKHEAAFVAFANC